MRTGSGGSITNNGTFIDTASDSLSNAFGGIAGTFSNAGTYNKNAAGTTTISLPFVNTGTVSVQGGTLSFAGSFTNTGGTLNAAGGNLVFSNALQLGTGTLSGSGTVTAPSISTGGLVSPGNSAGQLNLVGNLTLLGASRSLFELGGATQGSGYDFLSVSGTAALGGTLELRFINSFAAAVQSTDSFTLLAATSRTGSFVNVPTTGLRIFTTDGLGSFQVNFSDTSVSLSNFVAVPEPSTGALVVVGLAVFFAGAYCRRR